jgi:hypothetical protein
VHFYKIYNWTNFSVCSNIMLQGNANLVQYMRVTKTSHLISVNWTPCLLFVCVCVCVCVCAVSDGIGLPGA